MPHMSMNTRPDFNSYTHNQVFSSKKGITPRQPIRNLPRKQPSPRRMEGKKTLTVDNALIPQLETHADRKGV